MPLHTEDPLGLPLIAMSIHQRSGTAQILSVLAAVLLFRWLSPLHRKA
jgi:hypothetical protein